MMMEEVRGSGRSQSQSQNRSLIKPDQLMGSIGKNFAPFVSNSENPYDRHSNSKILKNQNIVFDGRMRNIAALIEKNKKVNNFKSQATFMRPASHAKREEHVDVTDILKYTLGEKRQR